MAVAVNDLEAIETQHEYAECVSAALGVGHVLGEAIAEQVAIGKAGKRIVRREV
jgi:hypothetical protein